MLKCVFCSGTIMRLGFSRRDSETLQETLQETIECQDCNKRFFLLYRHSGFVTY